MRYWIPIKESAWQFVETLWQVAPWLLAMGLLFSVLSALMPCNPGRPWWRKQGLATDLAYWIFVPVFSRYLRIWLTVLGTLALFGITTGPEIAAFYAHGHGPLSRLPLWVQGLIYLVVGDFLLYWSHRMLHTGFLWKYHAVHHASRDLEWVSAARFHPINLFVGTVLVDVVMLLAGISPRIFIVLGPFNTMDSVFVHANLNWTLGPLARIVAGPVFHRWHHTRAVHDVNFGGTFSLWDWMFGTLHMPKGELPDAYGIDDEKMPEGLLPQMVYPLRQP